MEGLCKRIIAYCTPAGFCINMEQRKRWIRDKVMHLQRQPWPPHSKSVKKENSAAYHLDCYQVTFSEKFAINCV